MDPVAIAQFDGLAGRDGDLLVVEEGAVGGPAVHDGPGAVGLADERGVHVRDAGVGGWAREVEIDRLGTLAAPPPDGDAISGQWVCPIDVG